MSKSRSLDSDTYPKLVVQNLDVLYVPSLLYVERRGLEGSINRYLLPRPSRSHLAGAAPKMWCVGVCPKSQRVRKAGGGKASQM